MTRGRPMILTVDVVSMSIGSLAGVRPLAMGQALLKSLGFLRGME
jgi:hypothetical protein